MKNYLKKNMKFKLLNPVFYCCIGISGSGKSTYINKIFEREVIVEPDAIRKEITGSVSDQSQDFKVWREVADRVKKNLDTMGLAVLDATNTHSSLRTKFLKNIPEGVRKVAIVFTPKGTDEEIINKLYSRIEQDIKAGKDRSTVPHEVVVRQLQQFKNGLQTLDKQFDEIEHIAV